MGSIDINGNQLIDYEEFIAATIHLNKLNREDLMMEAFKYFDKDNSGFITQDELMVGCLPTRGVHQRDKRLVDQGNLAARVGDTNLTQAAEMQRCRVVQFSTMPAAKDAAIPKLLQSAQKLLTAERAAGESGRMPAGRPFRACESEQGGTFNPVIKQW